MGTERAVSKELGHSSAPSCSVCSGPAACQAHRGCGATSREGKRGRVGAPQLQGLGTTGAVAGNSLAEAEVLSKVVVSTQKASGKELTSLGLLFCTSSAFSVIMQMWR